MYHIIIDNKPYWPLVSGEYLSTVVKQLTDRGLRVQAKQAATLAEEVNTVIQATAGIPRDNDLRKLGLQNVKLGGNNA